TQLAPAAAFGASATLVVWVDYRDSVTSPYIYGARVSPSGAVLDPSGIPVAVVPGGVHANPQVAYDGTDWMVAWGHTNGASIQATRGATGGVVLDPAGIAVVPSGGGYPGIACGAGECVIAFVGGTGGIQAVTISPAGVVTSGSPIPITPWAAYPPAVAFN